MNDSYPTRLPPPVGLDEGAASTLPQRIGRYRIERVLGQGGFGLVYLAHDDQLHRPVAIKVPHAQLISRPEDAEAYLTEARTVAALDHPNIVPVYDVGSSEECPCFVVSKLIEGRTLAQRLKANRPAVAEAVQLVATVAETLHYAHGKGLVHRDIKPGNILLDTSGKPYVADFGLALREENLGRGPVYAGTPAYMSPEQARGEGHRVDGRSDIFSLGVVFYQLLTGRRPFPTDSMTELLEQIRTVEVRPPRQWDDTIPKELERICLKAMSKRASERFPTAKDMAEDLRLFLAEQKLNQPSAARDGSSPAATPVGPPPANSVPSASSDTSAAAPSTPLSDSQPVRVVPKGLRSFDAHDADFFLELVPGPRDRVGLPDNIRFWKTLIEETDADVTFAVGLIYGPSGCGKSSLVKAGLLPRLSAGVIAVYVEATAAETETRLLNGVRKRCPALPPTLGLKETLAALRRGQGIAGGKKVLIVLDQFEQWLHARRSEQDTELVQALRQCDGSRVQCVVMVRDDFWMAATRFLRELEIRLVEGHNSAAVDLFPLRHAEKVLEAFGRAFGSLPENRSELGKDQKDFLEQAVRGLAQEGKVICVRLALFAEMVKGKSWTPATLKEVGGTEGVGVSFLEETFSAKTAPPEHRYHQKAARAVLKALLPESGTDIKGHMRTHADLLAASGYASRPRDFDDLLRILDSEIRLLTPTDPEGKEGAEEPPAQVQAGAHYYQLTHDYLVPSLREWLTRKQKETRRGRAELRLADRAALWTSKPENRHLPSWWEWVRIRVLTRKKTWTPPQRKMMRKATRYHALRGLVLAVVVALLTLTGLEIRSQVREQQQANHAAALVQRLLDANIAQVPAVVLEIESYRPWADPLLREQQALAAAGSAQQLRSSLALLSVDPGQVEYLYGQLLKAEPQEVPVLRGALAAHKDTLVEKLWQVVEQPARGKESQRLRAAAALAVYDPDSARWAKVQDQVANDLVAVPAVYLAVWLESLRPVGGKLLTPLGVVFRDGQRGETERTLATDILADYAADQPDVLADLLMDANQKQFAVLYPKFQAHSERGLAVAEEELTKHVIEQLREAFKLNGEISKEDEQVAVVRGNKVSRLPAKLSVVNLNAGKMYTMTMRSKELDAYLVLQDKTGKQLGVDDDSGGGLDARLSFLAKEDGGYKIYAASFQGTGAFSLTIEEADPEVQSRKEKQAKRQANAAVALLRMDRPDKVWPLLKHSRDPRGRSYLIHRFAPLGADPRAIIKRLAEEPDETVRRALILSLGQYGADALPSGERGVVVNRLKEVYQSANDPGLHAAAEWLLRTWKQEAWLRQSKDAWETDKEQREQRLERIQQSLTQEQEKRQPQWYVNGQGQTMVVIPGPVEFVIGSPPAEVGRFGGPEGKNEQQQRKRIGRSFAIAAKEVTVAQLLRFRKDQDYNQQYSPTADCPINLVTWYDAAAYCNWLSEQEGIAKEEWCYLPNAKGEYGEGMKLAPDYLARTGYRLPSEAEWEYACRAGALTSRFYGESEDLLGKYAWYTKNSLDRGMLPGVPGQLGVAGDTLKPNDFGLFDMLGNALEWCQDPYVYYTSGDDKEDKEDIKSTQSRVLRGGSFFTRARNVRSADRDGYVPTYRFNNVGFRPARTFH